jgi:hypothetical protein
MAVEVELSHDDAVAHKESRVGIETKTWHVTTVANAGAAASFLNLAPAQGAGEAFASNRADGRVDVYYFM